MGRQEPVVLQIGRGGNGGDREDAGRSEASRAVMRGERFAQFYSIAKCRVQFGFEACSLMGLDSLL